MADKPQKVVDRFPDSYENRNTAAPRDNMMKQDAQSGVPYKSGAATPNPNVK